MALASLPVMAGLSSLGLDNHGPEGRATLRVPFAMSVETFNLQPATCNQMKFQVSPAPGCEPDHSRKKLRLISGLITYTEGVNAGSPGLAMRSELPWV